MEDEVSSGSMEEENGNMIDAEVDKEEGLILEGAKTGTGMDEPVPGMVFHSLEELMTFYATYARKKGFAVSKRSSKKMDGILSYVIIQCTRGQKHKPKSHNPLTMRPTSKTDCKAKLTAFYNYDAWYVKSVEHIHNHEMSPGKSRFYKCNRYIQSSVRKRLLLNDKAGISMNRSYNSVVIGGGGYENVPFTQRDARNYVNKVRRLQLVEGDVIAMHNYFLKIQSDNSDFFYMMDLDEDGRLKNVFWADARSRAAFKEFGDVVTFDTTYLVNKYDMPFAPFVGVNHHGQSVLLGCGLVSSEDTDTFIWLFQSWLTCMSGCPPSAIITDQDRAMKKAVEVVFPNARHRWCLWHIMKKLSEKLNGYNEYKALKSAMKNAIYNSLSIREFEDAWEEFIDRFHLQNNEWLLGLYKERSRWVPAFVKDAFWAGMSTTQRSESINSFFDGYVNSKTTLKQFVEQYENALSKRVESEKQEDFNSYNSNYPTLTLFLIEKQFQTAYTRQKFKEFQDEMAGRLCCNVSMVNENAGIFEYQVRERVKVGDFGYRSVTFNVIFNEDTKKVDCDCRLFVYRGIMCRHQLMVYNQREIYDELPATYILKRWSKNIKRRHSNIRISYVNWSDKPEAHRYDKMCNEFFEVAEVASSYQDWSDDVISHIFAMKATLKGKAESRGEGNIFSSIIPTRESTAILDPFVTRSKGRPPTKRLVGNVEKATKKNSGSKKKRTSTSTHAQGYDRKGNAALFQPNIPQFTPYIGAPNSGAAQSLTFDPYIGVGSNFPFVGYQIPFRPVGGAVGGDATSEINYPSQGAPSTLSSNFSWGV